MSDATTNLVIGSAAVLGVGAIVNEKMPNMKVIFAGAVVVVGLSVLDNIEPQLSVGFAAIIFIALCAKYLPDAIDKLGYSGGGSGTDITPPVAPPKAAGTPTSPAAPASAFTPTIPSGGNPTTATPQNSGGYSV